LHAKPFVRRAAGGTIIAVRPSGIVGWIAVFIAATRYQGGGDLEAKIHRTVGSVK
jgi:hypothetical protein